MKKIKNLMLLVVIGMLFCRASCDRKIGSCVPPVFSGKEYDSIDWENYNNAEVVFANTNVECSDSRASLYNGKNIKIEGWLAMLKNEIVIRDRYSATTHDGAVVRIPIYSTPEIQSILATHLQQRCYIQGELKLEKRGGKRDWCCQTWPHITLKSLDDIYFE